MAAAEKQAQRGGQSIVLPDSSLDDELAATDSQRISSRRNHGVPLKEPGDRDGGQTKPRLVVDGERRDDAKVLLSHGDEPCC
jgi:hypothetical protein